MRLGDWLIREERTEVTDAKGMKVIGRKKEIEKFKKQNKKAIKSSSK